MVAPKPARSARPTAGTISPVVTSGKYVKLSDKLTDSINDITKMINQHKDMIDSIQDVGIQLTGAIGSLHAVTVKYAGMANSVLDTLLPLMKNFPMVPPKLVELATMMEKVTQDIIDNSQTTAKTISDVNSGLRTGDVNRLKAHSGELQKLTKNLTDMVSKIK